MKDYLFLKGTTMIIDKPRVSIGLPVYNGESFIRQAIDSILSQTYENFELIISDNASTDKTEEICREYASREKRVQYYRNAKNLGAAMNFNHVFELSSGEYFKWAAHDDICAPEYLMRCVEVLDSDPSVVVCHTKTIYIDENGKKYPYKNIKNYDDYLDLRSPKPHKRFHDYLFRSADRWNAIFGVIRANELKQTPLIGHYVLSDQVLLGELTLRGKIYRIPAPLFFRRDHIHLPAARKKTRSHRVYAIWFDPTNKNKIISPKNLRALFEYFHAIGRVHLSLHVKLWCYLHILKWGYIHLLWKPFRYYSIKLCKLPLSIDEQRSVLRRLRLITRGDEL